ncbi:MAG TPA: hypothetical protein VF266_22875 [Thermoanaerobaculia bacterium]
MPRSLLLGFVLLASFAASAAVSIAPLDPRIAPMPEGAIDPVAVTNGTTTLVAWTVPHHLPGGQRVFARLLGVHDAAVYIDHAESPQAGWNGHEYLLAYSEGAAIVHGNGALGERITWPFATVNAVAWDGEAWVVGLVRDGNGFVMRLDRRLNVAGTIELGAARSVRLTNIGGAVWGVQQRESDTEVFAVDAETPRYRIGGHARMVGAMAIVEETLHVALLDPRGGFSAPRPFMASTEVPLELVHAAPFGSGALFAVYSPLFDTLLLMEVSAEGFMQQFNPVLGGLTSASQVAVAGTMLFVGNRSQIYRFPLQPWPRQPFALTDDAIVSLGNFAYRTDATIVSNGAYAFVFWNERTGNRFTTASFMRAVDADGVPFGPVTQLPFSFGSDRAAAFHGDRFVLTWREDDGTIYASAGGAPVEIGAGGAHAVARGPNGSVAVWHNHDRGISGTPLRDDASPVVPGGYVISPVASEYGPTVDVVSLLVSLRPAPFFLVLSSREGTYLSHAGTPLLSFALGPEGRPVAGGELLAWPNGSLRATSGGEPFMAQWAGGWVPFAVHPIGSGQHLVILLRDRMLYTSIVTVTGDRIAGDTPPRLLTDRTVDRRGVTVIGGKPLVAYEENGQIWVTTYPGRRRAAR